MTAVTDRPAAAPGATGQPPTRHRRLRAWVDGMAELMQPDQVVWVDGSPSEKERLIRAMVDAGTLLPLDQGRRPGCYLARTDPGDVARVESRTFIACEREEDAGPLNNWREPEALRAELRPLFTGAMRGRTMYVVPFSMGPVGSPLAELGVELTDSPYVVVSMALMTRMGAEPLAALGEDGAFVPCVHTVGMPLVAGGPDGGTTRRDDVPWPCNETKYIAHFPETREIWSYGSGYGGNALLGKKCFALRIASVMAHDEGWLAEHMLLVRVTSPAGRAFHVAAAFPSACGKTNLSMLRSTLPGWRVETIGDDIVWMRVDGEGRLRAINPEAGFFGVAPGTGVSTNPTAVEMLDHDVVFTNVALTDDGDVWWEGLTDVPPAHLVDWRGQDWTPDSPTPAAHPNSRFTVAAAQCASMAEGWDSPEGVVVDAILFGGRRATTVPLVTQARSWEHGVFLGATVSSETTAAAEGEVGRVRRDPFAMAPFAGYHVADHWQHWLDVGARLDPAHRPAVFAVNWFRRERTEDGSKGRFLWPGYGENVRVLAWSLDRVAGLADAVPSAIGLHPRAGDLQMDGCDVPPERLEQVLAVDPEEWRAECADVRAFFDGLGDRVPAELRAELGTTCDGLAAS